MLAGLAQLRRLRLRLSKILICSDSRASVVLKNRNILQYVPIPGMDAAKVFFLLFALMGKSELKMKLAGLVKVRVNL